MKVALYIRVSTKKQKEEGSHENQEEHLTGWADRQGYNYKVFMDAGISGQSDDRPEYQDMMSNLDEFDAVVVRELSRLGRSMMQLIEDVERMEEEEVEFISLRDNFDTSSAQGKLLFHVVGAFSQFQSDLASERAEEMIQRRREEGKPIGRPKKLEPHERKKVREWRESNLSYADISLLVKERFDKNISKATVKRYAEEVEA